MRNTCQKCRRGWRREYSLPAYFTSVTKCTHCVTAVKKMGYASGRVYASGLIVRSVSCHNTIGYSSVYTPHLYNQHQKPRCKRHGVQWQITVIPDVYQIQKLEISGILLEKVDSRATRFDLRRWPKGLRMHRIIPHELIKDGSQRTFQYFINQTATFLYMCYKKIYF